ncbi:IQ domain-containing protein H isoform X4 [Corvus cornix cornix]|uniref:IQ domain-containing protein H isoform X4 n=1 Tax=Corvus cornix cornix TaxID=932674 RepID=UPI0019523C04|nr:IQ domain-containing protein H isoform X4 [Corvus cornix cornix]
MEKNNLKGNVEAVDICDLRTTTEGTELGLRKHAESYLNVINGQELTLSSAGNKEVNLKEPPKWGLPFGACQKQLVLPRVEPVAVQRCSRSAPRVSQGSQQQVEMDVKIMLEPENIDSKAGLKHPNIETRLPLITKKKSAPMCSQKTGKGHKVTSPWALPAFHSLNSALPLVEDDTPKAGIVQECHLLVGPLSLTGQRLILPAAKRTLPVPPVVSRAAPFPEFPRQRKKSAAGEISSRLDPENTDNITFPKPKEAIYGTYSSGKGNVAPLPSSNSMVSTRKSKPERTYPTQQLEAEVHIPSQTQPPQTAQPFQDPYLDWNIAVYHGTVDQKAPGFLALQQHYHSSWGSIVGFLEHTEKLLKDHAIPLATINGQKLAQIASDFDFNENPTKSDILSVIKNQSAVEKILNRPGQRCRGQGGTAAAAADIPRRWRCPGATLGSGQQQWAAGVLGASWRSWNHRARVRNALREARHRHLENFYSRSKHLAANWNRIRTSRRTIIHIPSLGYSQRIREHIPDLALQQNLQMGRLCDILDANVDVIYICPLALSEELLQYYNKLLGLQAAVRSGNPEDMADLQDRFKILTPEAINSFPEHHMCLATVLKYSPRTIQRLQVLIQSRDAYVVGGVPHQDDLAVADVLQVPLLGSEPAVAQLYSTKSGSKRIFASAGVQTPPGEWGIHSREQLLCALSQLILDNMEVQRWLFKVDDERGGNGTAYCDVISHLECYHWIQKEWQGHGPEVWSKSQARVWATDLDLCYSDQLALTQLLLYVTDGNLDCGSSRLQGPLGSKESRSQRIQHEGTKPPAPSSLRCAVASSQLRHSSLSEISYNLLLHTCKARGVGFDLQEKQGTVFVLYEDQKRHRLGMITIGEDLQGVLLTFARNLFIIHQEISAPNMQGETNFKMAIRDIEAILGVAAENKLKLEEEQPWEADALKE